MQSIGDLYNGAVDLIAGPLKLLLESLYVILASGGIPSWGLTIIIFTILVKLLFWPLTVQQLRASRAMQALQPQLNELKKLHGKDRERLMQEQMRLYRENRVNPMAGCLPMLIQLPIWIGLYRALYLLQQQPDFASRFLWIPNLARPEGFPFALAILTAVSQFIVQRMMQVNTTDPQQKSMNQAMQFMPIMYLVISYNMPAGLVLYWVASNVFTLIQQAFYTGWGSVLPWRTAESPAPVVVSRPSRREVTNSAPVEARRAGESPNGVPARSDGAATGATPRRTTKKRRK